MCLRSQWQGPKIVGPDLVSGPVAVAGSIADEFNTQRGIKGAFDFFQDNIVLNGMPNSSIEFDVLVGGKHWWNNATKNDIGISNIKLETAKRVYDANRAAFANQKMNYEDLVSYLRSDAGTVHLAALVILQAQQALGEYLVGCTPKKREAILVTYYKQGGQKYLGSFKKNLQGDPAHRLQPGEGCRVCLQRERFLKTLGITR